DFAMSNHFKTAIDNAVAAMSFVGATFGTGAGTGPILSNTVGPPLSLAKLQDDKILPAPGQNLTKVVVYFTDGLMNSIQDNIYCKGKGGSGATFMNYGGQDAPYTGVFFFDPTKPADSCSSPPTQSCWGTYSGGGFPYDTAGDICQDIKGNNVTTFTPQQPGKCNDGSTPPCPFNRQNVTAEAQDRAIQTAIALRTDTI